MVKCIYMLIFPSKKVYVGLTTNLKERFRRYKFRSRHPRYPVHYAMRKYGWDNVIKTIIEHCDGYTMEELRKREMYWIKYYGAFGMDGYNCTEGGEGSLGCKKSKKTLALMSRKAREYWNNKSAEERTAWGERTSNNWKGFSDEKKASINQKRKNYWKNLNDEERAAHAKRVQDAVKKRAVKAISPEGKTYKFESCREAARYLKDKFDKNFVSCSITQCINYKLKTHMGFRFEAL